MDDHPIQTRPMPPSRWELETTGERWTAYRDRFARLHAEGVDVDGEARFVDALLPRGAAVLDGGCGTGRVATALHSRGHRVVGVDRDAGLLAEARVRYPGVRYQQGDLGDLAADSFAPEGPAAFDAIVLAGNVAVYLAPGSERAVLANLLRLLTPNGLLIAGFATDRAYTPVRFDTDLHAVGLPSQQRFATWQLAPWHDSADWVVTVARREAGQI